MVPALLYMEGVSHEAAPLKPSEQSLADRQRNYNLANPLLKHLGGCSSLGKRKLAVTDFPEAGKKERAVAGEPERGVKGDSNDPG